MSSQSLRVALIGGSFNPPHVGHLLAAHFVYATEEVDQVWLVPAYRHPFGKSLLPFVHRMNMCHCLAQDASGWLEVSGAEERVGGEGRTVELLEYLKTQSPEHHFTWVIGSDIVAELPHWKDFDRIRQMARVLVLQRAGFPAAEAVGPPLAQVSSTEVRALLARGERPHHLVPRRVLAYAESHGLYDLRG